MLAAARRVLSGSPVAQRVAVDAGALRTLSRLVRANLHGEHHAHTHAHHMSHVAPHMDGDPAPMPVVDSRGVVYHSEAEFTFSEVRRRATYALASVLEFHDDAKFGLVSAFGSEIDDASLADEDDPYVDGALHLGTNYGALPLLVHMLDNGVEAQVVPHSLSFCARRHGRSREGDLVPI